MLYSKFPIPTLKEVPADASVPSHILMLRAGMIRKIAAGIYCYMPLGLRTIRKIESIIRQEMNNAGAFELLMPAVQPAELWEESGRWEYYGLELLRFRDRKGADFCLGPTHEEVITHIVRNEITSYRDLPINLYQIQTKFRDEVRPRFGLMRGREFIMKDAYSFDLDEQNATKSYWIMYETYQRIFSRFGLKFKAVEAGTGTIGGTLSHEFQVLAQNGEDTILSCTECEYAANIDKAECSVPSDQNENEKQAPCPSIMEVFTPDARTIEAVSAFLGVPTEKLCKTLIYLADGKPVAVLIRGDHELALSKLAAVLGADEIKPADDETVRGVTGAPVGFAGPIGLAEDIPIFADFALEGLTGGVAGANKNDTHITNIISKRDYPCRVSYRDLRQTRIGEICPKCGKGVFKQYRGIEVGQVFFLGTKYSERMKASVLDDKGKSRAMVMGCYGIGIGRTMAAAVEQEHDENGIIWPFAIAPFHVIICPVGKDPDIMRYAEELYQDLCRREIEVLLYDKGERPGVMFKNADLIGIPLRVVVGKRGLSEGKVELKLRREESPIFVACSSAAGHIQSVITEELKFRK